MSKSSRLLGPLLGLLIIVGCSDRFGGRKEISGQVTLKQEPLREGTIFFVPLSGQGSQANLFIVDGKFKADRKEGLLPGKYLIRISAADKKTGLVLTPQHITEFFCDVVNLNVNDVVFDSSAPQALTDIVSHSASCRSRANPYGGLVSSTS